MDKQQPTLHLMHGPKAASSPVDKDRARVQIPLAMEQDKQPLPQTPVPGFPTQTLDEIREEIRKEYPTLTEEEIDLFLSGCMAKTYQRASGRFGLSIR